MLKLLTIFFLVCVVYISCKQPSAIPLTDNIQSAFTNSHDYDSYVEKLNKSYKGDTTALSEFLEIDIFEDAAVYDHGMILCELMRINGDRNFANELKKKDSLKLITVSKYIKAGIDLYGDPKTPINLQFPESSKLLKM